MNTNGISDRHWLRVGLHFAADAVMFYLAILVGISLRFVDEWNLLLTALWYNWPGILAGSLVFSCAAYITGLYSWTASRHSVFKRGLLLLFCLGIALGLMMTAFYIHYVGRIGRGALLLGSAIAFLSVFAHHALLLRRQQNFRERLAFIVTSKFDELEIALNEGVWGSRLQLVGVVHDDTYTPTSETRSLGHVNDLPEIVRREGISRVLCTNQSMGNPALCKIFCQLRYSGVTVMPLISLCEEVHQLVPVELITPEWLLNASGSPEMIYIKKIKRGFDIVTSLLGLVLLSPFLLLGIIAVRLSSSGPVFYFQTRMGRFGRLIKIVKLRTMAPDAEKSGAVWAQENDPRVTAVGQILRRYRIDEIPQLLNVLKGQMSLVGPRPERPQFVDELAQSVPYYQERLMVQPGITGWAQVNYPYGASFEDARRKLEYDLYYMKHMSLFLDLFILLDTVRIILQGGLKSSQKSSAPRYALSPRSEVTAAAAPVSAAATVPPQ